MVNPYESPLVADPPEVRERSRPPLWRRTVSFVVHLLGYILGIFASMLSLTWTIEALKPKNAPLEGSLSIAAVVSLTVGVSVLWLGGALAKWIARTA